MSCEKDMTGQVLATVTDVLPSLGIVYLDGEDGRQWAITRSTRGPGLHTLAHGTLLRLKVDRYEALEFAAEYAAARHH